VVTAVGHDFNLRRLERYLAAVWDSGASPVIVLNKTDLVPSTTLQLKMISEVALAAPVVAVSGQTGDGLDALRAHLDVRVTATFIGSSGVGKSTLVNLFLEQARQPAASHFLDYSDRAYEIRRCSRLRSIVGRTMNRVRYFT